VVIVRDIVDISCTATAKKWGGIFWKITLVDFVLFPLKKMLIKHEFARIELY
jgi:hypothetical protein